MFTLFRSIPSATIQQLEELDDESVFLFLIENYNFTMQAKRERINLNQLTDSDLISPFHFTWTDLAEIADLLRLPVDITTSSRMRVSPVEGLFILCLRLASSGQLHILSLFFGYSKSMLSEVFWTMLELIYQEWDFLLSDFGSGHLSRERLQLVATKTFAKGASLTNCCGFIDCTIRQLCQPLVSQRTLYNGHKKIHFLKYSAVKAPDGLIYYLWSPYEGRRNDNILLKESGLRERMKEKAEGFCIFGDPAYPVSAEVQWPWSRMELSEEEKEYNRRMVSVRQCVEWGFADVLRLWSYLECTNSQKILQVACGKQYCIAVLFTNIHKCLYGCQTSIYFNCAPSVLSTYLQKPK